MQSTMSDNKDSGSGGKSNSNRSNGKYDYFCALTSGLHDVVFQPHSSAAQFKKNNDRLADLVGVTFTLMVPTMDNSLKIWRSQF